jgi:pimeloyl-ACP methyl ester carboxylesterase
MRRMAKLARFEDAEALSRYRQAYEKTAASAAVPIRVHDIRTTFGSTHVIEAGEEDKPPLVLLHAMCFSSTAWVRNLAALSRERRVLAIDTIGVRGRDDYARWFAEVLQSLQVTRTAIAGNSYGGWLAANFAMVRPDLVSHLVLVSPPLVFVKYRPSFYAILLQALLARSPARAENFARRFFLSDQTFDDAAARLWLDQFKVGIPFFRGMSTFPRPRGPFTDEELRSITAPTLLVEGEREPMHDPKVAIDRAQTLLPSIVTELLDDARHVPGLVAPEHLNQLILEHLSRHD